MLGLGFLTASIAEKKCRSTFFWGDFGAMLFIVALPLILLLPPTQAAIERSKMIADSKKICPYCAETIKSAALV